MSPDLRSRGHKKSICYFHQFQHLYWDNFSPGMPIATYIKEHVNLSKKNTQKIKKTGFFPGNSTFSHFLKANKSFRIQMNKKKSQEKFYKQNVNIHYHYASFYGDSSYLLFSIYFCQISKHNMLPFRYPYKCLQTFKIWRYIPYIILTYISLKYDNTRFPCICKSMYQ